MELPEIDAYEEFLEVMDRNKEFSGREKKKLRESTMLGGVTRWHGEIKRPAGIKAPRKGINAPRKVYPFRITDLSPLINSAFNYRDKTLWLLLASGGLRPSEALSIERKCIDVVRRKVYIADPDELRQKASLSDEEKIRFKGRNISEVWILPELKDAFFSHLKMYILNEYLPNQGHDYLFQYIKNGKDHKRGEAYWRVTEGTLLESFRTAIKKANILPHELKPDDEWDLYSLRHFLTKGWGQTCVPRTS